MLWSGYMVIFYRQHYFFRTHRGYLLVYRRDDIMIWCLNSTAFTPKFKITTKIQTPKLKGQAQIHCLLSLINIYSVIKKITHPVQKSYFVEYLKYIMNYLISLLKTPFAFLFFCFGYLKLVLFLEFIFIFIKRPKKKGLD